MLRIKWFILVVAVLVSSVCLGACAYSREDVSDLKEMSYANPSEVLIADDASEDRMREAYTWNNQVTIVVGEVYDTAEPDGWSYLGSLTEGFSSTGQLSWGFNCDVIKYYNYERLRKTAEADEDATYYYFNIEGMQWIGGKKISEMLKKRPYKVFTGDIDESFINNLRNHNKTITFAFSLDRQYRGLMKGDIVLMSVDPQLSINPNPGENDRWYQAVVKPFAPTHPEPYLAKFVYGKLQLPAELQDAFALRRLYDDTNPELTGIKDGDSVEDVVAFLKAVEQDMARYEEEQKQQPKPTDVSSIR